MADIKGVSPDTEIVTNKDGGKQSKSEYGFHLMDDGAMLALAEVLQIGATRYARDNWRKIPSEEHFNHMMVHYYAWKSGDTSDDHLGHMFCRAMMVYATGKAEREKKEIADGLNGLNKLVQRFKRVNELFETSDNRPEMIDLPFGDKEGSD